MSTYYTSKYSGEQIDEAVRKILDGEMTGDYADRQLSNLDTPQEALANLGAGVRPNLLDNAIFIGGGSQQGGGQLPVNQRGQTSYENANTIMIGIDRWILDWDTTVMLNSGYVTLSTGGMFQALAPEIISLITGKTITISCLDGSGDLHVRTGVYDNENVIQSSDGCVSVQINYGGKPAAFRVKADSMLAAKLEIGSTQTLAYQDEDGAWQLLPQPESDYATQLLKCQRYYYRSDMRYSAKPGYSNHYLNIPVQFPVAMRISPTVTVKSFAGTVNMLSVWDSGSDADISASANASDVSKDGIGAFFTGSDMNMNVVYGFCIEASADL